MALLEVRLPSDTVTAGAEKRSLRHMEPEHLSSLPREGHVPSPQEESSPRSGSTYCSLGFTRSAGGVYGAGAERRHMGGETHCGRSALSLAANRCGPPAIADGAHPRIGWRWCRPFTRTGDTRPTERQVASFAGKGAGDVFSVRRRTPPSSSGISVSAATIRRGSPIYSQLSSLQPR